MYVFKILYNLFHARKAKIITMHPIYLKDESCIRAL